MACTIRQGFQAWTVQVQGGVPSPAHAVHDWLLNGKGAAIPNDHTLVEVHQDSILMQALDNATLRAAREVSKVRTTL